MGVISTSKGQNEGVALPRVEGAEGRFCRKKAGNFAVGALDGARETGASKKARKGRTPEGP